MVSPQLGGADFFINSLSEGPNNPSRHRTSGYDPSEDHYRTGEAVYPSYAESDSSVSDPVSNPTQEDDEYYCVPGEPC